MAEGERFELSKVALTDFPDQRHRPLGDPSVRESLTCDSPVFS
jgi:hypothetical protein